MLYQLSYLGILLSGRRDAVLLGGGSIEADPDPVQTGPVNFCPIRSIWGLFSQNLMF